MSNAAGAAGVPQQTPARRGAAPPTAFAVSALFGSQRFTPRGSDDAAVDDGTAPDGGGPTSREPAEDTGPSSDVVPSADPATRELQELHQRIFQSSEKQLNLKNRLLKLTEKDEAVGAELEANYAEREALETDMAALSLRSEMAFGMPDTWEGKLRTADAGVKHLRERALVNDVAIRSGLKRLKEIMEKRKRIRGEIKSVNERLRAQRQARSAPNVKRDEQRRSNLIIRQEAEGITKRVTATHAQANSLAEELTKRRENIAKLKDKTRDAAPDRKAVETELSRVERATEDFARKEQSLRETVGSASKDELEARTRALDSEITTGNQKQRAVVAAREGSEIAAEAKRSEVRKRTADLQATRERIGNAQSEVERLKGAQMAVETVGKRHAARTALLQLLTKCKGGRSAVKEQRDEMAVATSECNTASEHVHGLKNACRDALADSAAANKELSQLEATLRKTTETKKALKETTAHDEAQHAEGAAKLTADRKSVATTHADTKQWILEHDQSTQNAERKTQELKAQHEGQRQEQRNTQTPNETARNQKLQSTIDACAAKQKAHKQMALRQRRDDLLHARAHPPAAAEPTNPEADEPAPARKGKKHKAKKSPAPTHRQR